jgi:Ca-activated chloride channel family protein
MSFIWPVMLAALILIPLLIGLRLLLLGQARRRTAKYGGFGVAQATEATKTRSGPGTTWLLYMSGISILLLALARPQADVLLPRLEGTVVLAFDVSGSMAADDFKPSRMEAAKAAAREFVLQQPPGVQIAVVAFSDTGFSVQPPSNDRDAVLAALNRLSPQRGTSVASGIVSSLTTIAAAQNPEPTRFYTNLTPAPTAVPTPMPAGQYTNAAIVLLSDGENNEQPDPMVAAQAAADRGVRIYTIGVGSPEGTTLHVNGFTVHTQLDQVTLENVAKITGGEYYNAPTAGDLKRIYDNLNPQLAIRPQKLEVTSMLGGLGAAFLVVGALLSLLRFGRIA